MWSPDQAWPSCFGCLDSFANNTRSYRFTVYTSLPSCSFINGFEGDEYYRGYSYTMRLKRNDGFGQKVGVPDNLVSMCELAESNISVVYTSPFSPLGGDYAMLLRTPCGMCAVWSSSPASRGDVHVDVSERAGPAHSPRSLHAFRYLRHASHN